MSSESLLRIVKVGWGRGLKEFVFLNVILSLQTVKLSLKTMAPNL